MSIESIAEKVAGVVGKEFNQPGHSIRASLAESIARGLSALSPQTRGSRWGSHTVVRHHGTDHSGSPTSLDRRWSGISREHI